MIVHLFYGLISKAANMKTLKKQKKKKKKKKKNKNNSNTNNNDDNAVSNSDNDAKPKLLLPIRELIEVINNGVVDCIDVFQKKTKKEIQQMEIKDLEKTLIGVAAKDNESNVLKCTLLSDESDFKLCRQDVLQKIYESHCHTYENILEQAIICDANIEVILNLLRK